MASLHKAVRDGKIILMRIPPEIDEYKEVIKKPNRLKKIMPKTHKIVAESGRSLKNLWQKIVERAKQKGT